MVGGRSAPPAPSSRDKLLRRLDDDIRQACEGVTPGQLSEVSTPLRDLVKPRPGGRVRHVKLFLLCICVCVCFCDWTPIVLSTCSRNLLIQVLPYWDWTDVYYRHCFIQNPYYEHRRLSEEDCEVCDVGPVDGQLPRVTTISPAEVAEDYLRSDVPLVLSDGTPDPAVSLERIATVLLDADPVGRIYPCSFATSLRLRGDNAFRSLLLRMRSHNVTSKRWYAHWENCDKRAAKALRRAHPRPLFLPPSVDSTEPNWVFVSCHYEGRRFKDVALLSDMLWVTQLQGSVRVRLRPRPPCNATCVPIDDEIVAGEILVFTDRLWSFQYLPLGTPCNIAVGGGGSFEN